MPKKKAAGEGEVFADYSPEEMMDYLNKKFGANSLVLASDALGMEIQHVSTGTYRMDFDLGGGFPQNRLIELRGQFSTFKSTLSLVSMRNFQRKYDEGFGIYVDLEKSFDARYAAKLGVDLDRLIVLNPDSGEQSVDMLNKVMRWNRHLWIVVDSVAALVPTAEIEADMQSQFMGLHARLVARLMRIVTARLKRSLYDTEAPSTTVLFLNQLRQKIGVMFGCMSGNTRVVLADGSSMQIRHIVNKRLPVDVLCWDEDMQQVTTSKVIDWHINGSVKKRSDFIKIVVEGMGGAGIQTFTCTKPHEVLTPDGWRQAQTLKIGDIVYSQCFQTLDLFAKQIILASHLADGCLNIRAKNTACLKLQNSEQPDYLKWKLEKLHSLSWKKVAKRHDSKFSVELALLRKEWEDCPNLFALLSPLGLAVWFMDDGHHKESHKSGNIAFSRFPEKYAKQAVRTLNKLFKLGCSYIKSQGAIYFNVDAFAKLNARICRYVPPCMQYKLLPEFRGKYSDFKTCTAPTRVRVPVKITAIKPFNNWFKSKRKYDLTVANYHTYLVGGNHNGVIVHNSPETTPGGIAKDFFYSTIIRLHASISAKAIITEEEERNKIKRTVRYGQSVDYKVIKNKCGGPQHAEGCFQYFEKAYRGHRSNSFDNTEALFEYGAFWNVIEYDETSGYVFADIKAKKESRFIELLDSKPKVKRNLYRLILEAIKEERDK